MKVVFSVSVEVKTGRLHLNSHIQHQHRSPPPSSLTGLDAAVDVGLGLVVDPVEPGLHGQARQHGVLVPVPVRRGDVHRPALVVQRLLRVVAVLVPALGDPQPDPGPQVHHRDGQRVQLVFAALQENRRTCEFVWLLQ